MTTKFADTLGISNSRTIALLRAANVAGVRSTEDNKGFDWDDTHAKKLMTALRPIIGNARLNQGRWWHQNKEADTVKMEYERNTAQLELKLAQMQRALEVLILDPTQSDMAKKTLATYRYDG